MTALILLLGGSGSRFDRTLPKQFHRLDDSEMVFERSFRLLNEALKPQMSVMVIHGEYLNEAVFTDSLQRLQKDSVIFKTAGGSTRHESFRNGIKTLEKQISLNEQLSEPYSVMVHDANRPLLTEAFLTRTAQALESVSEKNSAMIPVLPAIESLCLVKDYKVTNYIPRPEAFTIQTPQLLHYRSALEAMNKVEAAEFTDEGSFMLHAGCSVTTFEGCPENRKITYRGDL